MIQASIIIPAYRAEATIARAIESILEENDLSKEVIVVEDGVLDRTGEIVAKYSCVRLLSLEENAGAPHARNLGLSHASGKYVIFLDSDDFVMGNLIHKMVVSAEQNNSDITFGPAVEHKSGHFFNLRRPAFRTVNSALVSATDPVLGIPPCSTLWSTSFIRRIGGWDETLHCHQDIEMVFRGLARADKVACSIDGMGIYCRDTCETSITSRRGIRYTESMIRSLSSCRLERIQSHDDYCLAQRNLAERYYNYARRAYSEGYIALGRESLARARKLGLKGELGSYKHRLVAAFIGLQRKEAMFAALRMAAARLCRNWLPHHIAEPKRPSE